MGLGRVLCDHSVCAVTLLLVSAAVGVDVDADVVQCVVTEQGTPDDYEGLFCDGKYFVLHSSLSQKAGKLRVPGTASEPGTAGEATRLEAGSSQWWLTLGCALSCITCAALAAGLTLGLTSIDELKMQILLHEDAEEIEPSAPPVEREAAQRKLLQDQRCARRILPLISGHYFGCARSGRLGSMDPTNEHYLLVTLLLANATANEALPLFLNRLVPAWLACLLSVSVVLVFGEIIPSALFTGPQQLVLAAGMSPVVRAVRLLLLPLAWPLSLMLDKCLGHEEECYTRAHLKGLIRALCCNTEAETIEADEAQMIHGVLELHHKTAQQIAKPLRRAKMVAHDDVLDHSFLDEVKGWGHSRLFVYRREPGCSARWGSDITAVLLLKKLLTVNPAERLRVESVGWALKEPLVLGAQENLLSALNKFQAGQCHLAIISNDPKALQSALQSKEPIPEHVRPTMFCTLEDVIEALMKEEIYDEEDVELGRNARDWYLQLSSHVDSRSKLGLGKTASRKCLMWPPQAGTLQELRQVLLPKSPARSSRGAAASERWVRPSPSSSAPALPSHGEARGSS